MIKYLNTHNKNITEIFAHLLSNEMGRWIINHNGVKLSEIILLAFLLFDLKSTFKQIILK